MIIGNTRTVQVWSRVVKAGRDYRGVVQYVFKNPFKAGIANFRIDFLQIINGILYGTLDPRPDPFSGGVQQELFSS